MHLHLWNSMRPYVASLFDSELCHVFIYQSNLELNSHLCAKGDKQHQPLSESPFFDMVSLSAKTEFSVSKE